MEESIYSNLISFDSEDRDITKYPSANQWGIQLPENYKNIRSVSLYDSALPYKNIYTIHKNYQNNAFVITKVNDSSDADEIKLNDFNSFITKNNKHLNLSRPLHPELHTTQKDGCITTSLNCTSLGNDCAILAEDYQSWTLKKVRNNLLIKDPANKNRNYPYYPDYNKSVNFNDFDIDNKTNKNNGDQYLVIIPNGHYTLDELVDQLTTSIGDITGDITVIKNERTKSIYFENTSSTHTYTFDFDTRIIYPNCNSNIVFDYNSYWGLGYHLGFEKKQYKFTTYERLISTVYLTDQDISNKNYIIPNKSVRLSTPTVIYMEIDKYNSICEFKNKHNKISGELNSAFAKIFIGSDEHFNGNNINSIEYATVSKHKLFDRISNFNFKFRFHNDVLVEFIDNFNFTLKLDEVI